MKTAAVYCRVSTDTQEREGTSLPTQLEACQKYCRDRGYDAVLTFSETYSGLSLDRPELGNLREQIRAGAVDVVVCYSLDRLTRDPGHGVILTQEMEKHGVILEAVSEDVDNTELGKLISYIRGFASKLEAERIRERTLRGRRARAREGKVCGAFQGTYGYDYISVGQKDGGRRVINEEEAKWVRQMFAWLVDEGLSSGAIRDNLNGLHVPTKEGKFWRRNPIVAMLKNPAYAGKTYAFTSDKNGVRRKPREEWIELPGITPAIVSTEVFDDAQEQLAENRKAATRNNRRQYLLSGHVRCRRCGLAYVGSAAGNKRKDGSYRTVYKCEGTYRDYQKECKNKSWSTALLETIVLGRLEATLKKPEVIIDGLEEQRDDASQLGVFESQLQEAKSRLKGVERDQQELLRWALKGFPESQVEMENDKLNKARALIKAEISELESKIKAGKQALENIPNVEKAIREMNTNFSNMSYEEKRWTLNMLDITVWLDGQGVEVTGGIPIEPSVVVTSHS